MKIHIFIFCLLMGVALSADEILVSDGTVLKGAILSITEEFIEIETGFAGTLSVDRTQVSGFSTEEPVFVRLASGAVMPGTVSASDEGTVEITGVDGTLRAPLASVRQSWINSDQDPEILAREQQIADSQRKWNYQVAGQVSGKSGNNSEKNYGAQFSAILASKEDELKFYGSYLRKETEGYKTNDERILGMRYTSYFKDPWGWYVRQEFLNDEFRNLSLRSVTAAGISRRFVDEDHYKLSANAGISYRHETYEDDSPDSSAVGLDLGLQHFYRLQNRFEIHNDLTFVPSIEDFSNYLATQDSYVDVPLGDSEIWKLRVGLKNDYNSQPAGDKDRLDTTYYSNLVVDWE